MKSVITSLLTKQITIGSIVVKASTAAAVMATVAVVGGTVGVVAVHFANTQNAPNAVVSEENGSGRAEAVPGADSQYIENQGTTEGGASATSPDHVIPEIAHEHHYQTEILTASTCTVQGEAVDTCTECGHSETYRLPLTAHVQGEWTEVLAPTATTEGLREARCTNCGTILAREVLTIIPHDHVYVMDAGTDASCEDDGYRKYHCTICGSDYIETVNATGHHYDQQSIENATCTSAGHIYEKCSDCGRTKETGVIAAKGHNYGSWSTVKAATCTATGEETRKCATCGNTESRTIAAKGHTESNLVITKEATCTEEGTYTYTCSVCNAVVEENKIAALGHQFGDPVVIDSTCSQEGNKKYACERENCTYSYEEVIAKKDHTESAWIYDDPDMDKTATCTEAGRKHTECTECHAVIQTAEIPATGHSFGAWTETIAPKCEVQGEEKRVCSACGKEETREIAALEHHYETVIAENATCEQNGKKHEECSICHKKLSDTTIPALGHSFVNYVVVTPATDLAEGLERAACENGCGQTDERTIAKLPHTHDYNTEKTRVDATCTMDGYYIMECRCGSTMKVEILATGHTYEKTGHVDATCISDGSDTFTCSKCGDSYKTEITATGHTAGEWEVVKAATDLEAGQKVRKCTSCGTTLETQTISKLPHTCEYTKLLETQPATCTTDGYELYECRCGLTDKVILPRTNHKNAEWKVTKEATYTEMGLKEKICPDCQATLETEDIPVKPHDHTYQITSSKDATCTSDGITVKTCSICGKTTEVVTPATGHTESAFIIDVKATCTTTGSKHTECSVCHIEMKTETIPATGHTEGDWKVVTSATCTEDGTKQITCTECGAVLKTETLPATGHSMGEWKEITAAQCESAGTEQRTCSQCSYSESRSIPALGHDYGDWIIDKEATEESEGEKHKECSRCDSRITEDIEKLPPHVHNYVETAREDSSCSKTGSITYTCECGDSYTEEIAKKAHTPGEWTVKTPATEDATGLEIRSCTECGTQTDSRVIEKLPHTHNYVTDTKAATCTTDGYEKKTCACGSVINTVIPATGHKYGDAVVVKATCTKKGSSTCTCGSCGHKEVTEIAATGHHYVESAKQSATCGAAGSVTYQCTNCNDSYTEPIEKLEHDYVVTSTVDATCTEGGYTLETCKNCGDTKKTNETQTTGHDEGEWITVQEAELGVAGSKELRCTRCQALLDTEEIPMLTTDGTDSVYYFTKENNEQGMVIGHYNEEEAQEMLELVNEYRTSIDRHTLAMTSTQMNNYVAMRAVETSYLWDHTRPNGGKSSYSENIAMGNPDARGNNPSVQQIFEAWLNSPGHKANLDAPKPRNLTGISVFYKRCPVYKDGVETGRYVYTAYWVEIW